MSERKDSRLASAFANLSTVKQAIWAIVAVVVATSGVVFPVGLAIGRWGNPSLSTKAAIAAEVRDRITQDSILRIQMNEIAINVNTLTISTQRLVRELCLHRVREYNLDPYKEGCTK